MKTVNPAGPRVQRVREHATDGQFALKCLFPGKKQDTWPGLGWHPKGIDVSKYDLFSMDVFNPGSRAAHLAWRIDDNAGHKVFGGTGLPAGKQTRVDIDLRTLTGKLDVHHITQIYPYISRPHEDVLLYFDNFRLDYLILRFTPLVYAEDGPFVSATAVDRKRGFMLFHRHWMDFVFPDSCPRPGETPKVLEACAAPGEVEPVTISLRALRPREQVRAFLSSLRGPDGAVLEMGPSSCTPYIVRFLNKRVTYSSKQYIRDLPVYLSRQASVTVHADRSQRLWIDVRVPPDAAPGIYRGHVRIETSGNIAAEVPLRLLVWPFKLQEPRQLLGDYYQTPRPAMTATEKLARLEKDLRDMRARGATSVGLCFGCPTDQAVLGKDGAVHLNLPDDCLFVRFMDLYRDLGFPAPVVQLSDSGQGFARGLGAELGSEEYAKAYQGFWKAMHTEAKKRHWPEIIVQPVDEPGWQTDADRARNVTLLKLLKEIPGQRTEVDGPGDSYFHTVAGPWADVWNYNGALGTDEQLRTARKGHHLIMIYNCDVESWRPEVDRYVAGFYQERAQIDGCYNWAYMSFYGSPYDDLDAKTGTWMHWYPKLGKEPGGPSTGWEGFREGVDDLRYLTSLRTAIDAARKSGNAAVRALATAAETRLNATLETLEYRRRIRSSASWQQKRSNGKQFTIRGPYRLPNGWSFSDYDLARTQIAADIWRLNSALGKAPPLPKELVPAANVPRRGFLSRLFRLDRLFASRVVGNGVSIRQTPAGARASVNTSVPHAVPFINIPVIADAGIAVDGQLRELAWKKAVEVPAFRLNQDGGTPQASTHAWLLADSVTVYVGFECTEPRIRYLTANITADGGLTWKDDCVELFVDGAGTGKEFRQIVVNCLGKQFWKATDRSGWRAKSRAAAVIGKNRWVVELAVPLRDLGLHAGQSFGLNLCRERRPMEAFELSAWAPTGAGFGLPGRFGTGMLGSGCGLRTVTFAPPIVGEHVCSAQLAGGSTPRRYRLDLALVADGRTRVFRGPPVTVPTGGNAEARCSYRVEPGTGMLQLRVALLKLTDAGAVPEVRLNRVQNIRPLLTALSVTPALGDATATPRRFRLDMFAPKTLRKDLHLEAVLNRMDGPGAGPWGRCELDIPETGPVTGEVGLRGASAGVYRLTLRCRGPRLGKGIELSRPVIVTPDLFLNDSGK